MSSIPPTRDRHNWPVFLQAAPDGFWYEPLPSGHLVRCGRCWFNWTMDWNQPKERRDLFVATLREHDVTHSRPR